MSHKHKETGAYLGVPRSFPAPTQALWLAPETMTFMEGHHPGTLSGALAGETLTSQLPQRHDKTKSPLDPSSQTLGACLEVATAASWARWHPPAGMALEHIVPGTLSRLA